MASKPSACINKGLVGSFIYEFLFRFDFYTALLLRLQNPAQVVPVFDRVQMQGDKGAVATVSLPLGNFILRSCGHGDLSFPVMCCLAMWPVDIKSDMQHLLLWLLAFGIFSSTDFSSMHHSSSLFF